MKFKNSNSTLAKIWLALSGDEVKLMQATLDNGTVIEAEAWEIGEAVFIVTEDGNVPLPEGTYALEDGTSLVVEEEGVIASVGSAEAPEEETAEDKAAEVEQSEEPTFVTRADLEAALAPILEKISAEEAKLEEVEQSEEVKPEVVEQSKQEPETVNLSEDAMPAAAPVKPNPERAAEQKQIKLHSANRPLTTKDVVANKIYAINPKKK